MVQQYFHLLAKRSPFQLQPLSENASRAVKRPNIDVFRGRIANNLLISNHQKWKLLSLFQDFGNVRVRKMLKDLSDETKISRGKRLGYSIESAKLDAI